MSVLFISNNSRIRTVFSPKQKRNSCKLPSVLCNDPACFFLNSAAVDVLKLARDAIHAGWRLTHHPLYGNYRPNQQPYRSAVLRKDNSGEAPDLASLQLIEEALLVYAQYPALLPAKVPSSMRKACSLLDFELMRLPLEQADLLPQYPNNMEKSRETGTA